MLHDENEEKLKANLLTKYENLVMIAKCFEIAGFISNAEDGFHKIYKKFYDEITIDSSKKWTKLLDEFKAYYFDNLDFVFGLARPFLVIPTSDSESQTIPPELDSAEVQTLDPKEVKEMFQGHVQKKKGK